MALAQTVETTSPPTHIGAWRVHQPLGKGSFARVHLVQHSQTNQFAVAKIAKLDVAKRSDRTRRYVQREVEALARLKGHANIVQLLDVVEEASQITLILEHVDGVELYDVLRSQPNNRCSETLVRDVALQLLAALEFMHSNGVLWRDLKYENIMVTPDGIVKVIDFNLAVVCDMGSVLNDPCGTVQFCSPYILYAGVEPAARKHYLAHPGLDMWSFAVCLYGLSTGHFPFYGTEASPLLKEMRELAQGTRSLQLPSYLSQQLRHLLGVLLNPHFQWQANTVLQHVWFQETVVVDSFIDASSKRMERQLSESTLVGDETDSC